MACSWMGFLVYGMLHDMSQSTVLGPSEYVPTSTVFAFWWPEFENILNIRLARSRIPAKNTCQQPYLLVVEIGLESAGIGVSFGG